MKWIQFLFALILSLPLIGVQTTSQAQNSGTPPPASNPLSPTPALGSFVQSSNYSSIQSSNPSAAQSSYVLCASDVVQVKVYQEDDLESKLRISRDGTTTFPLIGVINLGGKTVEQAAALIRDELAKDYLVNPQVTVTVLEYAKRRFTVLGQVQKPGSYEIPNEESVSLLEAIAMGGGYTRLANRANILVTRTVAGRKTALTLDVNHAAHDPNTPAFVIQPDDIITVSERIF